jgi:hypothetical protein
MAQYFSLINYIPRIKTPQRGGNLDEMRGTDAVRSEPYVSVR